MSAATENYVEQLKRERDLALRDYEVMNKLREGVEQERDEVICLAKGHFYRPVHEYQFRTKNMNPGTPKTGQRYRYSCERCGAKTEWMSSRQHKQFLETACSTWGDE